jgi:hypothetical protein
VPNDAKRRTTEEERRKSCLTRIDQNLLISLDLARLRQSMIKLSQRLLTEAFQLLAHAEGMPFALRVADMKFVTDNSGETVAHPDFLELHNSCTNVPEQWLFAQQ